MCGGPDCFLGCPSSSFSAAAEAPAGIPFAQEQGQLGEEVEVLVTLHDSKRKGARESTGRGGGEASAKESSDTALCYLASMKLLQIAGVRLRQHRLKRPIVLSPA